MYKGQVLCECCTRLSSHFELTTLLLLISILYMLYTLLFLQLVLQQKAYKLVYISNQPLKLVHFYKKSGVKNCKRSRISSLVGYYRDLKLIQEAFIILLHKVKVHSVQHECDHHIMYASHDSRTEAIWCSHGKTSAIPKWKHLSAQYRYVPTLFSLSSFVPNSYVDCC